MTGRTIQALVDTEGMPPRIVVHSAGIQGRDGAESVLSRIRARFPWRERVWADARYDARQGEAAVADSPVLAMQIVR